MKATRMINRTSSYILGLVLAASVILPVVRADELNEATKVTFNQPIQIPGQILPAGTYWIQRANPRDPEILQVLNADHTRWIATLFTVSRQTREPTTRAAFVFADKGAWRPQALVAWFYPGRTRGHEFLYAKPEREELARANIVTVVAGD